MEYPDDMSESETTSTAADLEALRALQADASDLGRIEELLNRYNVFEAIGFTKQEIMHSRFLAFFLDPKRDHGLDDLFLRGLLRKCLESTDGDSLPRVDHHDGDLGQTTVHTEVYTGDGRIDILLLNEAGRWAMTVENKVWTTERSGQLKKYHQFVKENYPNHLVRGIYLTPHGDRPSHEEYLPLSYGAVCEILNGILEDRESSIPSDVRMSVEHYTGMVRRNIVTDPEISRLSREIFRKHYRALYVVIDNLLTAQDTIHKLVKGLIEETPRLAYGYREKGELEDYVVFDHEEWGVPALRVGKRYHGSDRLLYFVVYSKFMESLEIWLELGPGNTEKEIVQHGSPASDGF